MNKQNTGSWCLWWPESVTSSWSLQDYGTDATIHPAGTDFSCKTGPSLSQTRRELKRRLSCVNPCCSCRTSEFVSNNLIMTHNCLEL